jgi:hypothetical protein
MIAGWGLLAGFLKVCRWFTDFGAAIKARKAMAALP